MSLLRRVWRYQRGNQKTYIDEEQTTQWPKEKVQKYKQRSTKHTYKTKDRATRTPLKTGGELGCSGRVRSSCSTSDTRRVNLVTNPVISHEWWNHKIKVVVTLVNKFNCVHMIGWSQMNDTLHDMTPNKMLLNVIISPKKVRLNKYNKHVKFWLFNCFI
jgi:hypothetical protein